MDEILLIGSLRRIHERVKADTATADDTAEYYRLSQRLVEVALYHERNAFRYARYGRLALKWRQVASLFGFVSRQAAHKRWRNLITVLARTGRRTY